MASYDTEVPTSTVIANIGQSTITQSTQTAIANVLNSNTSGTVEVTVYTAPVVTKENLNGTNIAVVEGGNVNLRGASNADMAALDLILFSGSSQNSAIAQRAGKVVFGDTVTINNNNFDGVIVLGDANGKVLVTTNKAITVETGAGDDSVVTGRGNDSVTVVAGTDTVKTGAGNDKVIISNTYISDNSIVDGGTGKNLLDLTANDVATITGSMSKLIIGLANGGSLTASHFQSILLDKSDLSSSKVALNVITGVGNDSISLGSGADSVKIAGGIDSVNTGAGNDKLTFDATFTGKAVIDGGSGNRDQLDLSNLAIVSATKDNNGLHFILDNGATIDATNIEKFVYDINGSETTGGIKIVGIDQIIPLIEG
jgi:Ca2+-binding RTX toxin-like protein